MTQEKEMVTPAVGTTIKIFSFHFGKYDEMQNNAKGFRIAFVC